MKNTAEDIVQSVVEALQKANFEFMLVGSFSSNFYGIPRSTQDADFVVALGKGRSISELALHLDEAIQLQPQQTFEMFTATMKHELVVSNSVFRIELFHLSNDAHDQQRFHRRREVGLFGGKVWLPTAEDVIVTKLRWLRRKDKDDVRNILAVRRDRLDWKYIRHWCRQHQTEKALDGLIEELND